MHTLLSSASSQTRFIRTMVYPGLLYNSSQSSTGKRVLNMPVIFREEGYAFYSNEGNPCELLHHETAL